MKIEKNDIDYILTSREIDYVNAMREMEGNSPVKTARIKRTITFHNWEFGEGLQTVLFGATITLIFIGLTGFFFWILKPTPYEVIGYYQYDNPTEVLGGRDYTSSVGASRSVYTKGYERINVEIRKSKDGKITQHKYELFDWIPDQMDQYGPVLVPPDFNTFLENDN